MKLKEKINDAQFYIEPKITIVKLEQIADEFAIGFAGWLNEEYSNCNTNITIRYRR